MKKVVNYFANCNLLINKAMHEIISKHIPNPYACELQGYYFKKLSDILDHVFAADMIWMKTFTDIDNYGLNLVGTVRAVPNYGDPVFNNYGQYLEYRSKLDSFIIDFMSRCEADFFEKSVSRTTRSGEKMEKPVFKALIHFFNHQTHHRGQISNILDNMNIENNYSNMIYLE